MATMYGGGGGKIARAAKKVDKAKDKVGKAVSKYSIASTDSPSEYFKKKENAAKGAAKVGKAVAKVGKAEDKYREKGMKELVKIGKDSVKKKNYK
jgi:hypothetical protein